MTAAELVVQQGWESRPAGDGSNLSIETCPYCANTNWKFFINISGDEKDGLHDCKVCGKQGNLYQLRSHLGLSLAGVTSVKDAAAPKELKPLPDLMAMHRLLLTSEAYGDILDYLVHGRGFSMAVIEKMKLGGLIQGGKKFIIIPYLDAAGKPVFYKGRSLPIEGEKKEFLAPSGREARMFNETAITQDMDELVMLEGECLTGDTEVLTKKGWVRLDQYSGEQVAQWELHGTRASFVEPLAVIKKSHSGELINFTTKTRLIDLETTPNHRVLYREVQSGKSFVREAYKVPKGNAQFYRTAHLEAKGVAEYTLSELRLYVAIQADGSLRNGGVDHAHVNALGDDGWVIEVVKNRKKDRVRELLLSCNIEWSECYPLGKESVVFSFRAPLGKFSKVFTTSLYEMNNEQRDAFCEEVLLWDGHSKPDGSSGMYQSIIESNADLVQWAFSMSGVYANKGTYIRDLPRSPLHWVNVNLNRIRGHQEYCAGASITKNTRKFDGTVYCVQVPSSLIITRRSGAICVTGNCDTLSLLSQGYESCVGIPGASVKKAAWLEKLDQAKPKTIYLCYDLDEPGQKNAKEMAGRIGFDRVKNVVLPAFQTVDGKTGKDLNEYLCSGKTLEDFRALMGLAKQFDVHGVQSVVDILGELKSDIEGKGNAPKYLTPWPSLNAKIGGFEDGDVVGLMAEGKVGKTTMGLNLCHYYAQLGLSSFLYCLEMPPKRMTRKLVSHITQTDDSPGKSQITVETVEKALDKVLQMEGDILLGFTNPGKVEEVYDTIRQTVRRYGVKVVCFDNLQMVVGSLEHSAQETSKITKYFKKLALELNILILLIIQPNRVAEGMIISARNAMGSSAIEKDCDTMVVLHRNRVLSRLREEDFKGSMETDQTFEPELLVKVDLSRYSAGGSCTLYIDGATSTIRELGAATESQAVAQGEPVAV